MTILYPLLMAMATCTSAALPQELAFLEPLAADHKALVEAIRTFDKREAALAKLEKNWAGKAAGEGDAAAAREKKLHTQQRYALIRQAYEYGLEHYNDNAVLHNYYGEILYDAFGDQDAALKEWQMATALDSTFSPPYNNLAIHYCHFGDYRLGLQYYDQAIQLSPDNPDYLFNLAQMYLVNFPKVEEIRGWPRERVFQEAIALSKKAAQLAPNDFDLAQDYAVNFFAADNFGVQADWNEAAKAWQQARRITGAPDKVFYTLLNEGRVWYRSGNKSKAVACFEKALALRPQDNVAQALLEQAQQMMAPKGRKSQDNKKPAFRHGKSLGGSTK